jgi:hypothetical protein
MIMITGINQIFKHEGRDFHIQCEDLGDEVGAYEIRVYDGGTVLWLKRMSYAALIEKKLPQIEHEHELRTQMSKLIKTVEAAIVKGKIS